MKLPNNPKTQILKSRWLRSCLRFVLGCVVLSGCGDNHPETITVTGEVFHKGQPVEGASVVFTADGPLATGSTDAQGKFTLRTFRDGDGAIAGTHRVTITKNVSEASTPENPYPVVKNMLPQRYARPDTSQLTAVVEADKENVFRFELID